MLPLWKGNVFLTQTANRTCLLKFLNWYNWKNNIAVEHLCEKNTYYSACLVSLAFYWGSQMAHLTLKLAQLLVRFNIFLYLLYASVLEDAWRTVWWCGCWLVLKHFVCRFRGWLQSESDENWSKQCEACNLGKELNNFFILLCVKGVSLRFPTNNMTFVPYTFSGHMGWLPDLILYGAFTILM